MAINPKYEAHSMHQARLPYFHVSGGPFDLPQIMGWHIVNEKGFTIGVSCDAEFCQWLNEVAEENARLKARLAELEADGEVTS